MIVPVVGLAGVSYFITQALTRQKAAEQQAKVYSDLVGLIDGFHGKVRTLKASDLSRGRYEDELHNLKIAAENSAERLKYLAHATKGITNANTLLLDEAIEKADKYLLSFSKIANLETESETIKARSNDMLVCLERFRSNANLYGSPSSGDTTEAIGRVAALVRNYDKSCRTSKKAEKINLEEGGAGPDPIWSSPQYVDYHSQIASIVAAYAFGRRRLAAVLRDYDSGRFSDSDRSAWNEERENRNQLLTRINSLQGSMPPGTIYAEHHRLLQQMLVDAINAMTTFGNSTTQQNRQALSAVSQRNNAIMNRLKRFYGIR